MFYDYLSLKNISYSLDKQDKANIISTIDSMESTVENTSGLIVTIDATHAARLTGHNHFYAPSKVKNATPTFTTPFNKPALTHHNAKQDAIGRVIGATYIPLTHPLIPYSIMAKAETDAKHSKSSLQYIKGIEKFLYDRTFEGLGKTRISILVNDKDAIQKVLDKRYLTVSVGYNTDTVHCSKCFQEWIGEGKCEHQPGVDGMFLIFGNLTYDEVSFVNTPADELAQVVEYKMQDSIYIDSMSSLERIPAVTPSLNYYDSVDNNYKSIEEFDRNIGVTMKDTIKGLYKLGAVEAYKIVSANISEDSRLSDEQINALEDKDFVGKSKTFPVTNLDHIVGYRAYLDTVESTEKQDILTYLETREAELIASADSAPAVVAENATVASADEISYSFSIRCENGPWTRPEETDPVKEKAILDLLMSLVCSPTDNCDSDTENISGLIDQIISINPKAKEIIASKVEATDSAVEYEATIAKQRDEYSRLQTSFKTLTDSVTGISEELKDVYSERIASMKTSENPAETKEQFKDFLKAKSLNELKATVEIMSKINSTDTTQAPLNTDAVVNTSLQNIDSGNTADINVDEEIRMIDENYNKIKRSIGAKAANNYKAVQMNRINNLLTNKEKN